MSTEVELKLTARTADLPELRRALVEMAQDQFSSHEQGQFSSHEKLISTYFDTESLQLKQQGLSLRVREQAGQFVQTVKSANPAGAGMFSRGEWEDPLPSSAPDLAAPESGRHLPEDVVGRLHPLFVTDVTRTAIEIEPQPGTRIEAAIDDGRIFAVDAEQVDPISEIELELKSGDSTAIYDLALRLLAVAPVRVAIESKSERGYRLVKAPESSFQTVHAEPVALDPEMSVATALQTIGHGCLAQVLRNEAAVLAADPEGIHQMRVAVRRLRSAVSSMKEMFHAEDRHWVNAELRWLGQALGQARNLDVFATELVPAARDRMPDEAGWEELAASLDRLRQAAHDRVRDAVLSERYAAAILRLFRWFEVDCRQADPAAATIGDLAPPLLDRRRRKVRKRGKGFGRLNPHERHKFRIAAKKLRYTIELFGDLFPKRRLRAYTKKLKRLQDDLGYANDVRVAHDFLAELFSQIDPRGAAGHAWIEVLEWHDQRLAGGERKLRRRLRRLTRAAPFWQAR